MRQALKISAFNVVETLFKFQISATYKKSYLRKAFVKATIDGFSPGSVRVFFKITFDTRFLPK
jgi:hypothetical protein